MHWLVSLLPQIQVKNYQLSYLSYLLSFVPSVFEIMLEASTNF